VLAWAAIVKSQTTHSPSRKTIDECVEIPSPPPSLPGEVLAVVDVRGEPPKRGAGPVTQDSPKPHPPPPLEDLDSERTLELAGGMHHAAALLEPSRNAPRESAISAVAERLLHRLHHAKASPEPSRSALRMEAGASIRSFNGNDIAAGAATIAATGRT
jgi:hypothetical protein